MNQVAEAVAVETQPAIVVRAVPKKPFLDIFIGIGWDGWTRIFVGKKGNIAHVAGIQLPAALMATIVEEYNANT